MTSVRWFEAYGGETTDALLQLEPDCRVDSLVLAFEQAIQQKAEAQPISKEERYILAIEALEREVNNGGYSQFFLNSSHDYLDVAEEAFVAIGCPKTAAITRDAIVALGIRDGLTGAKAEAAVLADDETISASLSACDDRYFGNDEPIAALLFEWIKDHRASVRIGSDS